MTETYIVVTCDMPRKKKPIINGLRSCADCKRAVPVEDFRLRSDGYRDSYCGECRSERVRVSQKKHRDKYRQKRRAEKYGMTPEELNTFLEYNNHECNICGKEGTAVDHCHETGEVRGLLCHSCNAALGMFKDDPERLRRAEQYLSD